MQGDDVGRREFRGLLGRGRCWEIVDCRLLGEVFGIHRHRHDIVGVPKPLTHLHRVFAVRKLLRGKGMPEIVEPYGNNGHWPMSSASCHMSSQGRSLPEVRDRTPEPAGHCHRSERESCCDST
jgi:hypothetical protein